MAEVTTKTPAQITSINKSREAQSAYNASHPWDARNIYTGALQPYKTHDANNPALNGVPILPPGPGEAQGTSGAPIDDASAAKTTQLPQTPGGVATPNTPTTPQITATNNVAQNLATTGTTAPPLGATGATKYQTGLANATASGATAPSDMGQARGAMSSFTPPQAPDTSSVDALLTGNPLIDGLMGNITQLLNPIQQSSTLMEDYQSLYKQSGLGEINKEIIDADTVINGTEDDIRNEIQTAGGFGTDSQVQAMSIARNKNLLKRYNQLVQMKTDATNQLNTMMQLNAQDKQMAQTQMNNRINGMFQLANFAQQAQNNIKEQYRWLTTTMGADGIYDAYKSDPRQLAMLEKTLGVAPGGMSKLAKQAATERKLGLAEKQASINASNASAANSWANADKTRYETNLLKNPTSNPQTQQVEKADVALTKVKEAQKMLNASLTPTGLLGRITRNLPGSQGYTLNQTVSTIKNVMSLTELQKMRDASKTGGALGNITEGELELLSNQVASLDIGQDKKTLVNNLGQVQTNYVNLLNKMGYVYDQESGDIVKP